ncbi:MAG: Rrf2 family transcriptional regulator [Sideroxyarcus sp.]|nr:Rrf2 family transcriptional regulator [Sideroxyarcus sp.]
MRLTTKGRFAVTAMVDLTQRGGKGPVTLATISERQKISLSYLEQLFSKLRKNDVVASVRGPGGGYCLARPASNISIADIVVAVDEPLDATKCGRMGDCNEGEPCSTHDLWMGLNDKILDYLQHVSLQQLVDGQIKAVSSGVLPVTLKKMAGKSAVTA